MYLKETPVTIGRRPEIYYTANSFESRFVLETIRGVNENGDHRTTIGRPKVHHVIVVDIDFGEVITSASW